MPAPLEEVRSNTLPLLPEARLSLSAPQAEKPQKPNTFWIFSPLGLERQVSPTDTLGIYLSAITKTTSYSDGSSKNEISLGPTVEYLRYSHEGARGLGFGVAANFVGGASIGPSIYYVTRPLSRGVAFRVGASFPLGQDIAPFYPQLAIGFRF